MPAVIDGDRLVRFEGAEASVIVPDNVRYIDDLAFSGADSIVSIELPGRMDHIGNYAFRMCYCLEKIRLPDSVSGMGAGVFQHCWKLRTVTLPEGTEMIGAEMFESCHSLASLTIPDSCTSIARSAFSGCRALREIYIDPSMMKMLPQSARYAACMTYMEHHAGTCGNRDIDDFAGERQKNLIDLAINRRSVGTVRYMLERGLIADEDLHAYIEKSAGRSRIEITALLLEYSKDISGRDPFEEDPFI